LSGKCQSEAIVARGKRGYVRRKEVQQGECFGDVLYMISEKEKRTETVYSMTDVILYFVPRNIYIDLVRTEVQANKPEKMELVRKIAPLSNLPTSLLEKFLNACHIFKYEPNTVMAKVGDRDRIHFILEGQCKVNRLVPFLVKQTPGAKASTDTTEISGPYRPGVPPPPGEEVVYHNLMIGTLNSGDFFPRINLLRTEALAYRLDKVAVEKVVLLVNAILRHSNKLIKLDKANLGVVLNQECDEYTLDQEDSIAAVDLKVVAVDPVSCLVIHKRELLSEEVLSELSNPANEGLLGISIEEIQHSYFEKLNMASAGETAKPLASRGTIKKK